MELGIVKGSKVELNLDGEKESRVLVVELSDPEDVQEVELFRLPGTDENPADGTKIIVLEFGGGKVCISAADVAADGSLAKGERETYAVSGGGRVATIRQKTDGSIVLNAGEDWAVQFSAMKVAFDQLKSDHDALLGYVLSHSHTGNGVTPTPPVPPILPSTADMSNAKVDKVRLP